MHLVLHLTEVETLHSHDGKDQGVLLLPFGFCTGCPALPPQGVDHSLQPSFLGPECNMCTQSCAACQTEESSEQNPGPTWPSLLGNPALLQRGKEYIKDGDFSALTNVG